MRIKKIAINQADIVLTYHLILQTNIKRND